METSPDSQFYFERLATPRLVGSYLVAIKFCSSQTKQAMEPSSNHTDSSVLVLILEAKVLKEYTNVLKFGLQNEHNWNIIRQYSHRSTEMS